MTSITPWEISADAWISHIGERGDWAREYVIDPALARHFDALSPRRVLDMGCGEGRVCRYLRDTNIAFAVSTQPLPLSTAHMFLIPTVIFA